MHNAIVTELEKVFAKHAEQPALIAQDGQVVDFRNMQGLVYAFAENLMIGGVRPGDYVMVNIPNTSVTHMLRLALCYLGATYVIGNTPQLAVNAGVPIKWMVMDGPPNQRRKGIISFNRSWLRKPYKRFVPLGEFGIVVASSGTTGMPKFMEMAGNSSVTRLGYSLQNRPALEGPTLMAFGVASGQSFQQSLRVNLSAQPIIFPCVTAEETLERVRRFKATNLAVPSQYLSNLADAAELGGKRFPHLRTITASGGSISRKFAAKCEDLFGCNVFNTYGSTETGALACGRPSQFDEEVGVVGKTTAGRIFKFFAPDGSETAPTTGGEIKVHVKEDIRVRKFYNAPSGYDAEGFYAPGDIGYLREDGVMVITGRTKDIINAGGNKIAPVTIESAALEFPGVKQAAAFPIKNETGNEDAGLAVIVENSLDSAAFASHMVEKMGNRVAIRFVEVDSMPETAGQKIDRTRLKELLLASEQ